MKSMHALRLHKLKNKQGNNRKISSRHPYYIAALLKKRCGTLRQFLQAPDSLLDKQQIKLEALFKSLSI